MNVPDLLKNLSLDKWYKVVIYLGVILLIISLVVEIKVINNKQLLFLSLGFLFGGVGEWINHRKDTVIKPPNAYTGPTMLIEFEVWKPKLIGVIFDIIGIGLLAFSLYWILNPTIQSFLGIPVPSLISTLATPISTPSPIP